jgi:hypothetical protein
MVGFLRRVGACVGMNARSGRRATRLVARLLVNPARRCERGRCRLRAGQNGARHCGLRKSFEVTGAEVGTVFGPDFGRFMKQESEKWGDVIKSSGAAIIE